MKKSKISQPGELREVQNSLFQQAPAKYNPFPTIGGTYNEYLDTLSEALTEGLVGVDLEFTPQRPTIIGVSSKNKAVSVGWDKGLAKATIVRCQDAGVRIIGHSVIGAEKHEMEKDLDVKLSHDLFDDSMIMFHLCNSHLTKMAGKQEDEDSGALGLMNLWVMASMYTNLSNWKDCRSTHCTGPCPTHDVFGYNAVDTYASVIGGHALIADMQRKKIPWQFYRECMELADLCFEMEQTGFRVDRKQVLKLETDVNTVKDILFPYELINNKPRYELFNPKSTKEIIQYCKDNSITLPTRTDRATGNTVIETDKASLSKTLEKLARKEGYEAENVKLLIENLDVAEELSQPLVTIRDLYKYKSAGKGPKATFNPKYFNGNEDRLHPRFIQVGTSFGRLASAKPNGQNIDPFSKTAIIPEEGCDVVDADLSQLEMRLCLWASGFNLADLKGDPFIYISEKSEGQLVKSAADTGKKERDVAKRIVHAGNYMEGLVVLKSKDLDNPHTKKQIDAGALKIHKDWEYCGGVIAFTGSNLSDSLFGDHSWEHRKQALEIQDIYFKAFPSIRQWQRKQTSAAETGELHSPTGRYLRLYGSPEENAKISTAFVGQGTSADHVQALMLKFKRNGGLLPALMVHDSLVWFNVPKSMSNKEIKNYISENMFTETWRLPGFYSPGKVKRGPNYGALKEI